MKKLFIAGGVVAVVIVAVVFFTLTNLGPLVKKAVNTVGPKVAQTNVSVEDVNVSVFNGEAKVLGFLLGNPKGFSGSEAISVASVYVDIDEKSVTKNPIIVNKIEIIAPNITYEKKSGTDNFKELLKNIQSSAKSEEKKGTTTEKEGKKLIINNVIIKNGNVNLVMPILAGKEITAPLPDLHLKDIGKEKEGATPAEAFEKIFSALYEKINADSVTQVFNDGLKQLGNLKGMGDSGIKGVEDTTKQAVESATKDIESATQGVKNLFK